MSSNGTNTLTILFVKQDSKYLLQNDNYQTRYLYLYIKFKKSDFKNTQISQISKSLA